MKTALGGLSKDARRPTPIIVDFDAWRYGREINLLLPLLAQVQFQLKGDDPWFVRMRERIGGALRCASPRGRTMKRSTSIRSRTSSLSVKVSVRAGTDELW